MARTGSTQRALQAAGPSLGGASLALFLGGKWPLDWKITAVYLASTLRDALAREAVAPIHTRIVREVLGLSKALIEDGGIGLVQGDSGIGKTSAINAVLEKIPGCISISAALARARPKPMLEDIGRGVGQAVYGKSTYDVYDRVRDLLRFGSRRLLIVDEVHRYIGRDDCLHVLADLLKETRVPQLWAATGDLRRYIDQKIGSVRDPFAQVRSRITHTLDLNELRRDVGTIATADEIKELAARHSVKLDAAAVRELLTLANLDNEGGLRLVENVLKHVRRFLVAGKLDRAGVELIRRGMDRSISARTKGRLRRVSAATPQTPIDAPPVDQTRPVGPREALRATA
jgi:DNA transposition AAA+ family ATPase